MKYRNICFAMLRNDEVEALCTD